MKTFTITSLLPASKPVPATTVRAQSGTVYAFDFAALAGKGGK